MGCGASSADSSDSNSDSIRSGKALSIVPGPSGQDATSNFHHKSLCEIRDMDPKCNPDSSSAVVPFTDNHTSVRLFDPLRLICNFEDASPDSRVVLWSLMKGLKVVWHPPPLPLPFFPPPPIVDDEIIDVESEDVSSTASKGKKAGGNPVIQQTPFIAPQDDDNKDSANNSSSNSTGASESELNTPITPSEKIGKVQSKDSKDAKPIDLHISCDIGRLVIQISADDLPTVQSSVNMSIEDLEQSVPRHFNGAATDMLQKHLVHSKVTNFGLRHLIGHGRPVRIVGMSADGRMLVTGDGVEGRQLLLRCICPKTGKRIGSLANRGFNGDAPCDLSFSSNSQALVTCDQSDTVLIWDMTTYRCKKSVRIEGAEGSELFVIGVRISPDGSLVVVAAEQISDDGVNSGRVIVRNLQQKKQIVTFKEHGSTVLSVEISPDSKRIISGARDSSLYVWEARTGIVQFKLEGHASGIRSCYFSHCNRYIVSLDSKLCALWSAQSGGIYHSMTVEGEHEVGEVIETVPSPRANKLRFTTALFVPGGLLCIAYSSKIVRVMNPHDMSEAYSFPVRAPVTCATACRNYVGMGDLNGNVYILDIEVRATLRPPPRMPRQSTDSDMRVQQDEDQSCIEDDVPPLAPRTPPLEDANNSDGEKEEKEKEKEKGDDDVADEVGGGDGGGDGDGGEGGGGGASSSLVPSDPPPRVRRRSSLVCADSNEVEVTPISPLRRRAKTAKF